MTFKRPANDRLLTFEEISKETGLAIDEVELLVMKAFAQGLVKGSIDQVAGNVHMTWVQPRVLDKNQVIICHIIIKSFFYVFIWLYIFVSVLQ